MPCQGHSISRHVCVYIVYIIIYLHCIYIQVMITAHHTTCLQLALIVLASAGHTKRCGFSEDSHRSMAGATARRRQNEHPDPGICQGGCNFEHRQSVPRDRIHVSPPPSYELPRENTACACLPARPISLHVMVVVQGGSPGMKHSCLQVLRECDDHHRWHRL